MQRYSVAVFFTNYGPYHLARIQALKSFLKNEWKIIGIEITRDGVDYQWKTNIDKSKLSIISIFGNTRIDQINFRDQISKTFSCLNQMCPDFLVIAGYSRLVMLCALVWSIINKKTAILMSDSKEDDEPRVWWKEASKSFIIKRYSSALVAGKPQQRYLIKLGFPKEAIFSGYDVVDNNVFYPSKIQSLPVPLTAPYFLSINRFVSKKNLPLLINAYAQYQQQIGKNAWNLVLCGDGELRSQIETLIKQYQLENYIHLPGFLQQDELLPYFAHAKCFVHASTTEQWGLVVNEAMAAGLPVLVSNRCGCFEDLILEGVNGFGFDPNNQQQLSDLMRNMSSGNVDLESMGKASLAHIQNYSPEYFAQGLQKAINFAINQHHSK